MYYDSTSGFEIPESQFDQVERIKQVLRNRACGDQANDLEYSELRRSLMSSTFAASRLPRFVKTCRSLSEFWDFIKSPESSHGGLPSYASRRSFLTKEFEPLLEELEAKQFHVSEELDIDKVLGMDSDQISLLWEKAQLRCENDPEGAITAGKSMLESVLKHILHEAGEEPLSTDLLKLYKQTVRHLNLAPDQHAEQFFKQILNGCHSVVNGLASVRNQYSDSHGAGPKYVRPSPRHARFVVSIAGVLSNYLVETWHHVQSDQSANSVPVFQKVSP